MTCQNTYDDISQWLTKQGYSEEEIAKIRSRIRDYDHEAFSDSIMDSVAGGTFNLGNIIHQVLQVQ